MMLERAAGECSRCDSRASALPQLSGKCLLYVRHEPVIEIRNHRCRRVTDGFCAGHYGVNGVGETWRTGAVFTRAMRQAIGFKIYS